ncbi:asparaginase [Roseospira navarrensis]|uniref:Asparaginase n=1 Tax=Roseospira navarrensis TaxID=140058 RepID=A0A7X1ZEJ5_9PROT|nr:asparaginase [Roseospira navarrensis]MQX37123.1 asparaginase [Roseospira navarrensis]
MCAEPADTAADSRDQTPAVAFPDNPVLVATTRGETVENHHRGAAIVLDAEGNVVLAWGDVERPVFARSALKPMQALPLLEALPDAPDLTPERIALHASSHVGLPRHTALIEAWLAEMGLSDADLECGHLDWPTEPSTARAMARAGARPTAVHHNCAGQHAGFLRLAQAMGAPTRGYVQHDHPVQRAAMAAISDLTDLDAEAAPWGLEGCGIPSLALPLWAVALGMARLADPETLAPPRRSAAIRLRAAMAAHPDLIAGPGWCDTVVMETTRGRVLVKRGAEGNTAAMLPERGLGLALKIDDGDRRAAEVALGLVLETLGELSAPEREALATVFQPAVTNAAGASAGRVLPVLPVENPPQEEEEEDDDGDRIDPWDEGWDDDATG